MSLRQTGDSLLIQYNLIEIEENESTIIANREALIWQPTVSVHTHNQTIIEID